MINTLGEWLQQDGTIHIDVVLTNVDETCPIVVSSLRADECISGVIDEEQTPGQSGVPLVVVIGVSSGVGGLLVLVLAVTITVVVVLASTKSRRGRMAVSENSSQQKYV